LRRRGGETTTPQPEALDHDANLDPWVDWLKRITHYIEEYAAKLDVESWIHQARRRKWNFAARVATAEHDRWTRVLLHWRPELHFEGLVNTAGRRQARPKARWSDELDIFFRKKIQTEEQWISVAQDQNRWLNLADSFVEDEWRNQH